MSFRLLDEQSGNWKFWLFQRRKKLRNKQEEEEESIQKRRRKISNLLFVWPTAHKNAIFLISKPKLHFYIEKVRWKIASKNGYEKMFGKMNILIIDCFEFILKNYFSI